MCLHAYVEFHGHILNLLFSIFFCEQDKIFATSRASNSISVVVPSSWLPPYVWCAQVLLKYFFMKWSSDQWIFSLERAYHFNYAVKECTIFQIKVTIVCMLESTIIVLCLDHIMGIMCSAIVWLWSTATRLAKQSNNVWYIIYGMVFVWLCAYAYNVV